MNLPLSRKKKYSIKPLLSSKKGCSRKVKEKVLKIKKTSLFLCLKESRFKVLRKKNYSKRLTYKIPKEPSKSFMVIKNLVCFIHFCMKESNI